MCCVELYGKRGSLGGVARCSRDAQQDHNENTESEAQGYGESPLILALLLASRTSCHYGRVKGRVQGSYKVIVAFKVVDEIQRPVSSAVSKQNTNQGCTNKSTLRLHGDFAKLSSLLHFASFHTNDLPIFQSHPALLVR